MIHQPMKVNGRIVWHTDRLAVRFRYQTAFQVVDGSTVLAAFDDRAKAFQFVENRGARVWLEWGRTLIGARAAPYDFAATFLGEPVGRIEKNVHGPIAGTWSWSLYFHDPRLKRQAGQRGRVDTKDETVAEVERVFTGFIAGSDQPPLRSGHVSV